MTKLIECPGCTRHVRADDGRCPFCGRPSTTAAPSRMLALMLPLTLMACTGESPPPASKPKAAEPSPAEPTPRTSEPAEGGAVADPIPESDDRVMATKYGGPPVMHDPGPKPVDAIEAKPEPEEVRPAKKYGAPPRPAPKYGGPPKPGGPPEPNANDPLGGSIP